MDMSWLALTLACVLVLVVVGWNISRAFKYYIKFTYYVLWVTVSSGLFVPIFLMRPKDIRNMGIARYWFSKTLQVLGLSWEVRGHSNFNNGDKPCIFVCNHQSIIDVVGMIQVIPPRTTAIAKKELRYAGTFGMAAYLGGMIFVDRLNRGKAHETMEQAARIMIEENIKVWIYPEGTRNSSGKLLPFKKGAFHLAIQAQVPIFPVVFSSYKNFLSENPKMFESGKAIITCLPRVETAGLTSESVNELAETVRKSMESVFISTSAELAPCDKNCRPTVDSVSGRNHEQ